LRGKVVCNKFKVELHCPLSSFRPTFLCGGHLVTDSGIVASEGFPGQYKPNSKCTWYITVPEGHVVMLSFRLFDMEAEPTCRYDYLDVYNGHTRLVQKLGRFCGTFRPGALISTSNTMMLDMVSDEATGGRGFLAYFTAGKPHVEGNQFCGGRLTKSQGSIKTPNWPNSDYPAGISCSWHISVETGNVIEVKFVKLDLEADMYCRYDYVALFNGGEKDNSRRIGKFCGDRIPGIIVTNGNELLVQFISDLSVTSDGFMAYYSAVPHKCTYIIKQSHIYPPSVTTPIPPFFLVAVYIFLSLSLSLSVITGKITSLTAGPRGSATLNVSVIKAYKPGRLNMAKSGPATSVTLTSTCKRCPGLTKGLNYVLMGKVDAQGNGHLSPSSFTLHYKPIHAKPLAILSRKAC
uniref:CUB domain-containing protein n=1 Tax=Scophthalmus maximus TaxID=52904 RepID=A0A8D3BVK3_SCOMX